MLLGAGVKCQLTWSVAFGYSTASSLVANCPGRLAGNGGKYSIFFWLPPFNTEYWTTWEVDNPNDAGWHIAATLFSAGCFRFLFSGEKSVYGFFQG